MNVNPNSSQFTEVKPWDSLTDAEKTSGDWIEIPSSPSDKEPREARRRSLLDAFAAKPIKPSTVRHIVGAPGSER